MVDLRAITDNVCPLSYAISWRNVNAITRAPLLYTEMIYRDSKNVSNTLEILIKVFGTAARYYRNSRCIPRRPIGRSNPPPPWKDQKRPVYPWGRKIASCPASRSFFGRPYAPRPSASSVELFYVAALLGKVRAPSRHRCKSTRATLPWLLPQYSLARPPPRLSESRVHGIDTCVFRGLLPGPRSDKWPFIYGTTKVPPRRCKLPVSRTFHTGEVLFLTLISSTDSAE